MITKAVSEGGKVRFGGSPPQPASLGCAEVRGGSYYLPTVVEVTRHMEIWKEEVFGPVVVAIPFKNEAEAVELANDSKYGLAAAIWTQNVMRAHRVADKLNVRALIRGDLSQRRSLLVVCTHLRVSVFYFYYRWALFGLTITTATILPLHGEA
jgi:hypothetical protein